MYPSPPSPPAQQTSVSSSKPPHAPPSASTSTVAPGPLLIIPNTVILPTSNVAAPSTPQRGRGTTPLSSSIRSSSTTNNNSNSNTLSVSLPQRPPPFTAAGSTTAPSHAAPYSSSTTVPLAASSVTASVSRASPATMTSVMTVGTPGPAVGTPGVRFDVSRSPSSSAGGGGVAGYGGTGRPPYSGGGGGGCGNVFHANHRLGASLFSSSSSSSLVVASPQSQQPPQVQLHPTHAGGVTATAMGSVSSYVRPPTTSTTMASRTPHTPSHRIEYAETAPAMPTASSTRPPGGTPSPSHSQSVRVDVGGREQSRDGRCSSSSVVTTTGTGRHAARTSSAPLPATPLSPSSVASQDPSLPYAATTPLYLTPHKQPPPPPPQYPSVRVSRPSVDAGGPPSSSSLPFSPPTPYHEQSPCAVMVESATGQSVPPAYSTIHTPVSYQHHHYHRQQQRRPLRLSAPQSETYSPSVHNAGAESTAARTPSRSSPRVSYASSVDAAVSGPPPSASVGVGVLSDVAALPSSSTGAATLLPVTAVLMGPPPSVPTPPPPPENASYAPECDNSRTVFLSHLPPTIQNGMQLEAYVPSEGVLTLRVKRIGQRDVGFALYDTCASACAALRWFRMVQQQHNDAVAMDEAIRREAAAARGGSTSHDVDDDPSSHRRASAFAAKRGILSVPPPTAAPAEPLTYAEYCTCVNDPLRLLALLRDSEPLQADWARGSPTYRPAFHPSPAQHRPAGPPSQRGHQQRPSCHPTAPMSHTTQAGAATATPSPFSSADITSPTKSTTEMASGPSAPHPSTTVAMTASAGGPPYQLASFPHVLPLPSRRESVSDVVADAETAEEEEEGYRRTATCPPPSIAAAQQRRRTSSSGAQQPLQHRHFHQHQQNPSAPLPGPLPSTTSPVYSPVEASEGAVAGYPFPDPTPWPPRHSYPHPSQHRGHPPFPQSFHLTAESSSSFSMPSCFPLSPLSADALGGQQQQRQQQQRAMRSVGSGELHFTMPMSQSYHDQRALGFSEEYMMHNGPTAQEGEAMPCQPYVGEGESTGVVQSSQAVPCRANSPIAWESHAPGHAMPSSLLAASPSSTTNVTVSGSGSSGMAIPLPRSVAECRASADRERREAQEREKAEGTTAEEVEGHTSYGSYDDQQQPQPGPTESYEGYPVDAYGGDCGGANTATFCVPAPCQAERSEEATMTTTMEAPSGEQCAEEATPFIPWSGGLAPQLPLQQPLVIYPFPPGEEPCANVLGAGEQPTRTLFIRLEKNFKQYQVRSQRRRGRGGCGGGGGGGGDGSPVSERAAGAAVATESEEDAVLMTSRGGNAYAAAAAVANEPVRSDDNVVERHSSTTSASLQSPSQAWAELSASAKTEPVASTVSRPPPPPPRTSSGTGEGTSVPATARATMTHQPYAYARSPLSPSGLVQQQQKHHHYHFQWLHSTAHPIETAACPSSPFTTTSPDTYTSPTATREMAQMPIQQHHSTEGERYLSVESESQHTCSSGDGDGGEGKKDSGSSGQSSKEADAERPSPTDAQAKSTKGGEADSPTAGAAAAAVAASSSGPYRSSRALLSARAAESASPSGALRVSTSSTSYTWEERPCTAPVHTTHTPGGGVHHPVDDDYGEGLAVPATGGVGGRGGRRGRGGGDEPSPLESSSSLAHARTDEDAETEEEMWQRISAAARNDTDFQLARHLFTESFFTDHFPGVMGFRPLLNPPFFGACFVHFARPEDALICLRWLRQRRHVLEVCTVEFARSDTYDIGGRGAAAAGGGMSSASFSAGMVPSRGGPRQFVGRGRGWQPERSRGGFASGAPSYDAVYYSPWYANPHHAEEGWYGDSVDYEEESSAQGMVYQGGREGESSGGGFDAYGPRGCRRGTRGR